jgi:holin-like protein
MASCRRLLRGGAPKRRKVEFSLKILGQIGIVFGVCWLSQCLEQWLPVSLPASVIGLLFLLLLLLAKLVRVEHIREVSDFLLGNLPFFFIPAVVSIMNYVDVIWANAAAFLTVCIVSMLLTYGATVWAVGLTMRWMNRRRERK